MPTNEFELINKSLEVGSNYTTSHLTNGISTLEMISLEGEKLAFRNEKGIVGYIHKKPMDRNSTVYFNPEIFSKRNSKYDVELVMEANRIKHSPGVKVYDILTAASRYVSESDDLYSFESERTNLLIGK